MQAPADHPRESERLALLRACGVLDTSPEPDFDGLVDLASAIAGTPIALVSLVDESRQWFKARHGLDATETPRSVAFCAHAILDPEHVLVVPDARQDPRFHDNPLVTGGPEVTFYAGVPLKVGPEQLPVGTLCVIDQKPGNLTDSQRTQLQLLGRQVEMHLDLRRRQHGLEERLVTVRRNEERIQAIVSAMDEGLVVQDRTGAILSCNPAACRILQLSEDQLCGRSSLDPQWCAVRDDGSPFPGEEHPAMVTLRTGRALSGVIMGVGLQGGQRSWILINSQPVGTPDAQGLPDAAVTTFTDITRLRHEAEERRRAEGQVAHFFNLSLDMLCLADFQGRFTKLNPAWTQILGWTTDELCGVPFLEFVHPEDHASTLAVAEGLARGEATARFENRYRCKDGSWKVLQWTSIGVPHHNTIFALARDVTKDRQRESELVSARRNAEDADRAKSTFLATMSHEIRTPMNGVLGMAELLASTRLDDEQKDMLETIRRSGRSLLTIINDILDWSKIQAGRMELAIETVSLAPLLKEVLAALRPTAAGKGLRLECVQVDPHATVQADPLRLQQVLTNLIGNAIKFTDRGEVTVSTSYHGEQVRIHVQDSGIGIPAEHLPRLFTRFTQVDEANTRRFGGTGLGLAISLQLAEAMGGTVTVSSTVGSGSTFTVHLRAAETRPVRSAPVAVGEPSVGRPLHLLMAEDNAVNRKVAQLMLARLGHQVVCVENGREALAADLTGIDAILMDVQMPEMDGLEATRQLRTREQATGRRRMPIIALTAAALQEEQAACLVAGMDQVMTKPLDMATLTRVLATFV